MRPARSPLAEALREARRITGLTQEQLGEQLGVKGRAVYRWERDESQPNFANQRRVIQVIEALDAATGAKLRAAIAKAHRSPVDAPPALPAAASPVLTPRALVEQSVFTLADELDLPARRVRVALSRWLRRLREAPLALEVVQRELDAWVSDSDAD